MPEYLSPGVYIQEVDSGPRPIEGVGTACAAFVGFAANGPANTAVLVTSWNEYVSTFGKEEKGKLNPHRDDAFLSHSVYGYFLNGGGRCYVTNIVPHSNGSNGHERPILKLPTRTSKAVHALSITARDAQSPDITIEVQPPSGDPTPDAAFTLRITRGSESESYNIHLTERDEGVPLARRGPKPAADAPTDGKPATVTVAEVSAASRIVTVVEERPGGLLADRVPAFDTYTLSSAPPTRELKLAPSDFTGDPIAQTGV